MLMDLKEISVIHHAGDDVFNVIRLVGFGWNHRGEFGIGAIDGVRAFAAWRIVKIVRGKEAEQLADHREAFGIVMRHKVRHA